jgi:hypothetical protein
LRLREQAGLAASGLPKDDRDARSPVRLDKPAQNVEFARPSDETGHSGSQAKTLWPSVQMWPQAGPRELARNSRELPD